ncbi:MAG TPA: FG-GAP repeat protein, partial [Polyangiaceae bacterium]|nr:FG-GAP repeat protein [Polyangiaceae bacterium]
MKLVRSLLVLALGALELACQPAANEPVPGSSTQALGIRPQSKLWTTDAAEYAEFGQHVALDENALLVGAPFESITEEQSGAAHLFERQDGQWQERPRIVASPTSGRSRFGRAAVLSASELVIGADWDESTGGIDSGAVYVYSRADMALSQKLEPAALDGRFGSQLARHGEQLLIGAPYEGTGAAYLFEREASGWQPGPRLAPLAEANHYYFGRVLSLSDTVAAVGAEAETYEIAIFEREGSDWQQVETLSQPNGGLWGNSVVVDEKQVLVGDPEGGPRGWGAVHVFERELSYMQVATLTSDVPSPGFGGSLALEAGRLVVGCYGAAVVFEREGQQWHEVEALFPQDANPIAGLTSVALWADDVALGAPRASALNLAEPGAVFVFAPCSSDADCKAPDHCESDGACHPPKANAASCESATECDSGFCADGVCCNAACQGSCEACAETEQLGRCVAISGEARGEREPCRSHELCGGRCDGISRACTYAPRRTPCDSSCVDEGELISSCDGSGRCIEGTPRGCGQYACRDRACRGFCEDDDDCSGAAICVSATCVTLIVPACSEDGSESITEGKARQCGAYRCDTSTGACATACASSTQCATGFVCDDETRNCVELHTSNASRSSSDCGCRAPGHAPAGHSSWLLFLGSALFVWRRRMARLSMALLPLLGAAQLACAPSQAAPEGELGQ